MSLLLKRLFAVFFLALVVGAALFYVYKREAPRTVSAGSSQELHEASYYEPEGRQTVECFLCPNRCVIAPGGWGKCKARKNIQGKLYSMVYGKIAAEHLDPIEKKPLFHFLPGSKTFSIASTGCNMRCLFCQNWDISQRFPDEVSTYTATPQEIIDKALSSGAQSIAFTYNEPVINFEFMLETARLAKSRGLRSVVVSSGYIEEEPLKELLKYVDGYKVDLKAFDEKFYRKLTGGSLAPVLETMKTIKQSGVWLEIVTLIVPGENDSPEEIRKMARWIKENLGESVPLHFTRFYPQYKLTNLPPTPLETLIRSREIAMAEGLQFVYVGNIAYSEGEATYCPRSQEKVIERNGYFIVTDYLKDGACSDGEKVPGVWK